MDARVVGKPRRGGNGRSLTLPPICRALWNAKLRIGACGTIYELAGAVPGAPGAAGGGAGSEPDGPTTSHPPSQNHGATGKRPAGGFPNLYILGVDIWPAVGEDGRHEDESVRGGGRRAGGGKPSAVAKAMARQAGAKSVRAGMGDSGRGQPRSGGGESRARRWASRSVGLCWALLDLFFKKNKLTVK